MKRLPRGKPAQIMGSRGFQTMYTAEQMRKAVADEREACARIAEEWQGPTKDREIHISQAIRARGNT